jgi:hypothetical protein
MNLKEQLKKNISLFLVASLSLGLAPFVPEPHVWGKLKWIMGGGAFSGEHPMQLMDWFDLLMHGTPWVLLIISASLIGFDFIKQKK